MVQNQAQAENKVAEANMAAYKEDDQAAGADSHKQDKLGAKEVPLEKKRLDHQHVPQNDQVAEHKDEEKALDKEIEKQQLDNQVLEKERESKEKLVKEQDLERAQKEKQQESEKEEIERKVQARVEKERQERERREKLAREQQLEEERAAKVKLTQQEAAEQRVQQEIRETDNEIPEKARKEQEVEEPQERQAQLKQVVQDKNGGKAARGAESEDGAALKKGGRDLKEKVGDPREGVEDGAVKADSHLQVSHERDQGETDLRRRRRALGPGTAGGAPEKTGLSRGVHGLEPLLELGGSDLHAALEEQLLAGAMVHSRQIKQTSEEKGVK